MNHNVNDYLLIDAERADMLENKIVRETKYGYLATEEGEGVENTKCVDGKHFKMLHWIFNSVSPGMSVDHLDFNTRNNKRDNLRLIPFLVNCMRKKQRAKFRGAHRTRYGKYVCRYSRTYIGTFHNQLHAAQAYNVVLKHVLSHHGYLRWYAELKNQDVSDENTELVSADVLKRVLSPSQRNSRNRPVYADFWEVSYPVKLHRVDAGMFAIERPSIVEDKSQCVRCSQPLPVLRNDSWTDANVRFYMCEKCTKRQE